MREYLYRTVVLILVSAFAAIGMLFLDRIPQDPGYHFFADTRVVAGIQNFWNVVSNAPFLLVGIYGLGRRRALLNHKVMAPYTAFCLGAVFIGLGSASYHYEPSTATLILDRLPMTVGFMAVFSMLLEERVRPGSGISSLWPLLAAGIGAAAYWYWSEMRGVGDLRLYALVQFLPMLLIPLILLMFRGNYLDDSMMWRGLALYGVAKVFEYLDRQVLEGVGALSGHSIKHILASIAVLCMILAVPAQGAPKSPPSPTAS